MIKSDLLLLQEKIHANAIRHGFWSEDQPSIPEKLALIHSEVSEALEEYRNQNMEVYAGENGKPEGFPIELADVVIRCLDLAEWLGIEMETVINFKMAFNKQRGYLHGKLC